MAFYDVDNATLKAENPPPPGTSPYRDKTEIERWRLRDPLTISAQRLLERGSVDETGLAAIEAEVVAEVDVAVAAAEAGGLEDVADLARHVVTGAQR